MFVFRRYKLMLSAWFIIFLKCQQICGRVICMHGTLSFERLWDNRVSLCQFGLGTWLPMGIFWTISSSFVLFSLLSWAWSEATRLFLILFRMQFELQNLQDLVFQEKLNYRLLPEGISDFEWTFGRNIWISTDFEWKFGSKLESRRLLLISGPVIVGLWPSWVIWSRVNPCFAEFCVLSLEATHICACSLFVLELHIMVCTIHFWHTKDSRIQ